MNSINQQITGSCFKRELNEQLKLNKLRRIKTDAELYTTKQSNKQREDLENLEKEREKEREDLETNKFINAKADAELYALKTYDNKTKIPGIPEIPWRVQLGGLIEISLPNYKLKYKDNYLPIISATYYDTGKQWVLKLSDVGGNIVNVTVVDSKTYDILSSDEIECSSGGKGMRKRKNKSRKNKSRKNKSRKKRQNKSRRR
jgi:hypothetical protein